MTLAMPLPVYRMNLQKAKGIMKALQLQENSSIYQSSLGIFKLGTMGTGGTKSQ